MYLFFLNRLQNFDDTALVINSVNAFKHLAVFTTSHLPDDLVVILVPAARMMYAQGQKRVELC